MVALTTERRVQNFLEVVENLSFLPKEQIRKIKKGSPELAFIGAEAMRVQEDRITNPNTFSYPKGSAPIPYAVVDVNTIRIGQTSS